MPDDNDLPLQDTQATKAASDASSDSSNAASGDLEPASETLIQLALMDLQSRREGLEQEIRTLQQRKEQLEKDMAASFAGQSDAIARRVKGFQEYLGGALQGLAQSVETLELVAQPVVVKPSPLDAQAAEAAAEQAMANSGGAPALADTFRPDEELIRTNLRRFLEQPDFYAEPWKLRRSLDDSDIAAVSYTHLTLPTILLV